MDGAALKDEIIGAVAVDIFYLADLAGDGVVGVPGEIQAVRKAAVGVEPPVGRADAAPAVYQKARPGVAYPRVVHGALYDADVRAEALAGVCVLRGAREHGDGLEPAYYPRDLGIGRLRALAAVAPYVGALRPQHPDLLLRFKLPGHSVPVPLRRAAQSLCHFFKSFLSFC